MSAEHTTNNGNYLLEKPTLQALYYAPVPIFISRDDGRLLLVNRTIVRTTGFTPGKMPTLEAWIKKLKLYPQADSILEPSLFFETADSLDTFQVSVETQNGPKLVWELFNAPLAENLDGRKTILSIALDITDRIAEQKQMERLMDQLEQKVLTRTQTLNQTIHRLENEILEKNRISEALSLSRERLKEISRHTLDILEADRQTISKELHDSIGASLAAIKFSLEEKELKRSRNNSIESLKQEVDYIASTIKETKRISANLRPSTLDDLGLVATISWYLRQFERLYGNIKIDYSSEIAEKDIHESMKINIYRIIQEALTNAERHSGADRVKLSLNFCDGRSSVSLIIEDNGCGFQVDKIRADKDPLSGYGLVAMRERCEIFGGSFHIDSDIGRGTRINAILPLK